MQRLTIDQLAGTEVYVVTLAGDTIRGQYRGSTSNQNGLVRMTIKSGDEKMKLEASNMQLLAVQPGTFAQMGNVALFPALESIENEAFTEALPTDGWVFYERQRMPTKKERYQLLQVLNRGFDQKVKVYAHPNASSTGGTSLNGIVVEGNLDNQHFVSVNGGPVFKIDNLGYKKRALKELYSNCELLAGKKLKWKDFARHVFQYDQECE